MSIEKIMNTINKKLGEDTITFCTEGKGPKNLTNPSGSLTLDMALGGGIARAKIIEVFGDSMAGKTTLAFLHMAERQREGEGYVAFVDFEHAMNKKLAAEYGVDLDRMIYVNPKTAENGVDVIDALIRSGEVRLIVLDSVAAMVPTKIVESSAEQQTMALLARFMGTVMQKLTGIAYEHDCTLMFINQIRGTMALHGPQTTTSGGKALPFYSSQRIQVKRADAIKDGDDQIGRVA